MHVVSAGLKDVPALVEGQAELSLLRGSVLQCVLAAEPRVSSVGNASQSHTGSSGHAFHSHATSSQRVLPTSACSFGAWGTSCECRSASHWGQTRFCQSSAEDAVLRSPASVEVAAAIPSEAQSQLEVPPDVFEIAAAEARLKELPLSALNVARSLPEKQPASAVQPKHGRPSRHSPSRSQEVQGDRITSLTGLQQLAGDNAATNEVASLEQGVEDPGGRSSDGWEDYISIVSARKQAAGAVEPSLAGTL